MPDFRWDPRALSYRGPRGRFVTDQAVREGLDAALQSAQARMSALAESLRERRISLAEWHAGMARELRNVHLYSAAAAKGGWAQMTQADFGRVGAEMRRQYRYLGRFVAQLEKGLPTDGAFLRRVELYAQSGRGSYHAVERRERELRGYNQERNILALGDHCEGCVGETARGWVPIGQLVPVGHRECRTRCKCRIGYRRSQDRSGALPIEDLGTFTGGFRDSIDDGIAALPPRLAARLQREGFVVRRAGALVDARPDLRGVAPRGAPNLTWENLTGLTRAEDKSITVAERFVDPLTGAVRRTRRGRDVFLHEAGHATDLSMRVSDSRRFISAIAEGLPRLTEAQRSDFAYLLQGGEAGRQELFAEIFASVHTPSRRPLDLELLEAFPEAAAVIRREIALLK